MLISFCKVSQKVIADEKIMNRKFYPKIIFYYFGAFFADSIMYKTSVKIQAFMLRKIN